MTTKPIQPRACMVCGPSLSPAQFPARGPLPIADLMIAPPGRVRAPCRIHPHPRNRSPDRRGRRSGLFLFLPNRGCNRRTDVDHALSKYAIIARRTSLGRK
jgi:hypothetical protein